MAFKKPISLKGVKTSSIKKRKSKVTTKNLAGLYKKGDAFKGFLKSLPSVLAADDLKAVTAAILKNEARFLNARPNGTAKAAIDALRKTIVSCGPTRGSLPSSIPLEVI